MPKRRIPRSQIPELTNILDEAFDLDEIETYLLKLDIDLNKDIKGKGLNEKKRIEKVVGFLNKKSKIFNFIKIILADNDDPDLAKFQSNFLAVSPEPSQNKKSVKPAIELRTNDLDTTTGSGSPANEPLAQSSLQRATNSKNRSTTKMKWSRGREEEIERQVCRIDFRSRGEPYTGTGFLVGSDIVITAYHLVEKFKDDPDATKRITLRFDYAIKADGVTPSIGRKYFLSKSKWLIDYSQWSPLDYEVNVDAVPQLDELDYALLCIAGFPGNEVISDDADMQKTRGWIDLPSQLYEFEQGTELRIMHHPHGEPMQLSYDTSSIISVNENRTRVRYKTNTGFGSSGAPCFTQGWKLIALHHATDPNFHKPAKFNQGIPISTILNLLDKRGLKEIIGKSYPYSLSCLKQRDSTAFPYLMQLYDQVKEHNPDKLEDLSEWLEKLCNRKNNEKIDTVDWLLVAVEKHITYVGVASMHQNFLKDGDVVFTNNINYSVGGMDDKISSGRAANFFKDKADSLMQRKKFLESCRNKWSSIEVGDPIIKESTDCLLSIQVELNQVSSLFYMYTVSNGYFSSEIEDNYKSLRHKHKTLKGKLDKVIKLFSTMNIELAMRRRNKVLGEMRGLYSQLIFEIEFFSNTINEISRKVSGANKFK